MAKSRRNNGGCTRGRFKLKKMGKGYSTLRKIRSVPRPKTASADAAAAGTADAAAAAKTDQTKA